VDRATLRGIKWAASRMHVMRDNNLAHIWAENW